MTISKTFHCTSERAEQIFVELMLCIRKKHLVRERFLFRTNLDMFSYLLSQLVNNYLPFVVWDG